MKKALYILLLLAVIVALFLFTTKDTAAPAVDRSGVIAKPSADSQDEVVVEYLCDQGVAQLILSGEDFAEAQITTPDGTIRSLTRAVSTSGTSYADVEGDFVFQSKGSTAFITNNDEILYDNCNEQ